MPETVEMSIVLPTHNCLQYLKMFLASMHKNSAVAHELVIVCDICTDGTQDWLAKNGYSFVELNDPHPPSAEACWVAWTYGFGLTTRDYICFANDDQIYGPYWDTKVSPYLKPDKVIGCQLIEPGTAGKPWRGIIEKNFGDNFLTFNHGEFEAFAAQLPSGTREHEGVDISTIWHRDRFKSYLPEGWSKLGPTVLDETQPYVRVLDAAVYHFSGRSRNLHGDSHLVVV